MQSNRQTLKNTVLDNWLIEHSPLFDFKQLHIKNQLGVSRDARQGFLAIRQMRRDENTALAADGHANDTTVQPLDDFALTDLEGERLPLLVG